MKVSQIISSYNRPQQLDLLLRSIIDQWQSASGITIIWKASNEQYRKGYEKLIDKYLSGSYIDKYFFLKKLMKVRSPSLLGAETKKTYFKSNFDEIETLELVKSNGKKILKVKM